MKEEDALKFFFELGMLRKTYHQGWKIIGVDNPDTVAEHSLRAAQIGFILAKMEGYSKPEEVCAMVVFHDIGETRVGDLTRVNRRYVTADEESAVNDQTQNLGDTGKEIKNLWSQVEHESTKAGMIAKDADRLEQAVMAKEYMERGFKYAKDWLDNTERALKTESAKKLLRKLRDVDSDAWWQGVKYNKDLEQKKL